MRYIGRYLRVYFMRVVLAIFLMGCSSFISKTSQQTPEKDYLAVTGAQEVLSRLKTQNQELKSFKGIGKIKLWLEGELKIDERIAWIGADPNKLSIVVLVSGYPAIKIANDGKWFYYYEANQDQPIYKKIRATDASLERLLSIKINPGEIIALLKGRVPLREHDSAFLLQNNTTGGLVLILKKKWWGVTEKIFLDQEKTQVSLMEFFSRSGSISYRAQFKEMQDISGYQVPSRLYLFNKEGSTIQLDIQRYWTDVPVSSEMFVLSPPD
ncbi:MAG: hypothetical protein PVF14_19675 [Desulfobacterales bacterium]